MMGRNSRALVLILTLAATPAAADAWWTDNVRSGEGREALSGRVAELDWLVGSWVGEGLGGTAEYHYSPPSAGTMTGSFKHLRGEEVNFYEFIVIGEFENRTALRLKHFHPDLSGWEAADEWVEFPLLVLEPGRAAYFDGLTYRLDDDGTLHAYVAVSGRDARDEREIEFRFRRR